MKSLKSVVKQIAFFTIFLILFWHVQDILTQNDYANGTPEKAIKGYWALDENTVDVLIFGASHPEFGISPMMLYEDKGITSYNLATGNQPIEVSYYFLKEALKTQTPKVVILDPSGLFADGKTGNNAAWRLVFDNCPLDDVKIELAKDYGARSFSDGIASVFFPIIKFHSRWNKLSEKDFMPHWNGTYYSAGGLLVSYVNSTDLTLAGVESDLKMIRERDQGYTTVFDGETTETEDRNEEMFYLSISDNSLDYFHKMKDLCSENGATFVLVTLPTLQYAWAKGGWNSERSQVMKEFAAKEGVAYFDLTCDFDEIDYKTDSFDRGIHLNCRGERKVTEYLGDYLQTLIPSRKDNEKYNKMLSQYNLALNVAELESEKNFYDYLNKIAERVDKSIILITAYDEYTQNMTAEDYALMHDIFGTDLIADGKYTGSYLAIVDGGQLVYEAVSSHKIEYKTKIDGLTISMCSSGWLSKAESSTKIDGVEYGKSSRGLNIVVYDKESNLVIDSVTFDTHQSDKPGSRDWNKIDTMLRAYESEMCFY